MVDHTTIFQGEGTLPTFNSNAIESCLHRIPHLSEHYVTLNGDVFIGRPIGKEHFFYADGTAKIFMSLQRDRVKIGELVKDGNFAKLGQFYATLYRARKLVFEKTGVLISQDPEHTPCPSRKSDIERVESVFNSSIYETRHLQFRDSNGIYYLALCSFYLIAEGALVKSMNMTAKRCSKEHLAYSDYIKISIGSNKWMNRLEYLLIYLLSPSFFCLNDNENATYRNRKAMKLFLACKLFKRSPAELPSK